MASEDEDLLDDSNFKDLGELEDLDDDAENALLGDSDEEGSNRARDRALSLMSSSSNRQQLYSGDEDEVEDVEEEQEQEFEYVDEEGNPVEIGSSDDVEYVEVSQDDSDQPGLDESANEFVLDLEVDADLEFDDSGMQDSREGSVSSSTKNIQHTKPKAKPSLPTTVQKQQLQKGDKRRQLQQQKLESHKQQNQRQQQEENRRQQQYREQQWKREQQQRKQQEQRNKEQQEQQRIQQQNALRLQKQQQFVNVRNSSFENEKSLVENEELGLKPVESYNNTVNNDEDQHYNASIKNETSESDDEEESGRGRFRTERSNVISVSAAKKRPNIPDSLEAVISHEEAARLERSNRQQSKKPWHRGGSARDMPRDRERDRNRDQDRDKGRHRDYDRNYKEGSLLPRHQEIGHSNLAHFQQHSDSAPPSLPDSDSSTNSEQKAPRKILINPHFKGSIIPSSEAMTKTSYSWDNQTSVVINPCPSDHSSTGPNEFHYIPPQQASEGHFGASFGTQATSNMLNQQSAAQNSLGQFHFTQPPPIKHNTSYHVPPPAMPDFQNRPPPLMSIPPLIPPTNNHLGAPVNHFPPPREPPAPRLTFEAKAHDLPQVQFQTGSDSWTHASSQHNFKPYNVPPPNQGFPPISQNAEQPPPNFPNVQQPPPPIQRTEFQHQLVPPVGPPPSFNRPPPGFDISVRLGGPPPSRPMSTNWPAQQQRPPPPMLLPVFNRPPPPVSIASHQNNFQITSLPPTAPSLIQPMRSSVNESLRNISQFSPPRIHLRQPFTPAGQSTNLRSLPQQQQHQKQKQQQQQQQQQQHQHQQQQSWSSSNLRPIAQQKQPLFGKRPNNEAISASPLKQIRISNQPLPTGRRMPQVNTNIRQVEIVDKLPAADTLSQGPNRTRNSSQQASYPVQSQQAASHTLKIFEEKGNPEAIEEDEETRCYRQQIELQKKKREEVLRRKEQRRVLMAHERRKQMLQQQQQQTQEMGRTLEPNDALLPSPTELTSTKLLVSSSDIKQRASNQNTPANAPEDGQLEGAKKRVVYFRRVVTRPFTNMRRPAGAVGSPIRTVTNASSLLNPVSFPPRLQPEQKIMIQHLPLQLHSQDVIANIKTKIPNLPKQVADEHWMHMTAFNNNSNLTNITIQMSTKNLSQNPTGILSMRNAQSLVQVPRQAMQPLQQLGRPSVQPGKPFLQPARPPMQQGRPLQKPLRSQQSGKLPQHPGQQYQQPRRPIQQKGKSVQQFGKPFQQSGRLQQFGGLIQQPGGPQQQSRESIQQSGRSNQQQLSNAINKPVTKILVTSKPDVIRPCQMMTTEVGVVNVSPDVKLRTTSTGISGRVVINSNKRALLGSSAQPLAKRTPVPAAEVPPSVGAIQRATIAPQQSQQQVLSANDTSKVQIENLAQATSDVQLRKLCQSIGPVESINLFKDQRRALVKFKNVQHAKQFMDRYQRRMVDLSLIAISLVS